MRTIIDPAEGAYARAVNRRRLRVEDCVQVSRVGSRRGNEL
jgi:hypothetical protein